MPVASDSNTLKYVAKPLVAGGLAAGATVALSGAGMIADSEMFGEVPLWLVVGASFAVASGVMTYSWENLAPHVEALNFLDAPMHAAANVAATSGVAMLIENAVAPGMVAANGGPLYVAASAAAIEVLSSYIVDEVIKPMRPNW